MGIQRYLDLSTSHLTPSTMIHNKHIEYMVADYPEGAIYFVPEIGMLMDDRTIPDDLFNLLVFAAECHCQLVRVDADAPILEELATYEWMETLAL